MTEDKDLEQKKVETNEEEELERLEILSKSKKVKGEQLTLDEGGDIKSEKEIKDYALGTIDDPDKKHDIYYNGIQKLMIEHLPEGEQNKKARDIIYEEKKHSSKSR